MNVSLLRHAALGLTAAAVVAAGPWLFDQPAAAREAPQHEKVFLVQGTPGASVDVSIDGHQVAQDMSAKDVIGPLDISAGAHAVRFSGSAWAVSASFTIDGPSTDVVLHMPAQAAAEPVVTVFKNDVKPVATGRGRLVIAHTAVVPPADVRVDGQVLFSNIANGEFVGAVVPAQTYSADIVPTGEDTPLFGPVDVKVTPGALTRVFAIGEPTNGGMDAIVQVLPLTTTGSAPPKHVDTGSAGLVASPTVTDREWVGRWFLLGGFGALLAAVALRRRLVR